MIVTQVIAGFPGVGKSCYTKNNSINGVMILDSDSSEFSWLSEGVRHPNFPKNYIEHIKKYIGVADVIFVSSHDVVRKALEENDVHYSIVYPDVSLKNEYIKRYEERGSDPKFIEFISSNWEKFIDEIEKEKAPNKFKLQAGQFVSDLGQNKRELL